MRRTTIVALPARTEQAGPEASVGTLRILESQAAPEQDRPRMGWRECSISGCPCRAFVQSYGSDLCGNCGHKYTDHW